MFNEDQKKDILLDGFEVLKDDVENNSESLAEIVAKMFAFDKYIAINMWEYLSRRYDKKHEMCIGDFCNSIIYEAEKHIEKIELINIIKNNEVIKEAVFGTRHDAFMIPTDIIPFCITTGLFSIADEFLNLYCNGESLSGNFPLVDVLLDAVDKAEYEYQVKKREHEYAVQRAIRLGEQVSEFNSNKEEIIIFIYEWSKRLNSKADLAKINVALLKLSK